MDVTELDALRREYLDCARELAERSMALKEARLRYQEAADKYTAAGFALVNAMAEKKS